MNTARRQFSPRALLQALWPVLLPLVLSLVIYRDVASYKFVNFDDDLYVEQNAHVMGGLTPANLGWALSARHGDVWVPATWWSFQLDAAVFGPDPGGFHRTNLVLHLLNVLLVFLIARRLGCRTFAATLVAALFGAHPLNVEAVAWVTARKDVLMGVFLLGSVLAWLSLAGARRTVVTGVLAVLAMMAKPAAVVLPLLLLLLSLWEDHRAPAAVPGRRPSWRADLPLLALLAVAAIGVSLVTVNFARTGEMGAPLAIGAGQRVLDAAAGVGRYLARLAWPHNLAARYPEAGLRLAAPVAVALGVLWPALTALLVWKRRRAPLAALGWLWFLACLLPSIGLVQGGQLPMGDRYVYLAAIGLWVPAAVALERATAGRRALRVGAIIVAVVAVGMLAGSARKQTFAWRTGEDLWRHALAVTRDNDLAHQNLAVLLDAAGKPNEALSHLDAAIAIHPRSETNFNKANILAALGRGAEAEECYRAALRLNPGFCEASQNLGSLLGMQGRLDEARAVLLAAAGRRPNLASLQYNLAVVAARQGDRAEAAARCRRTLELDPSHEGARDLLAIVTAAAERAPAPAPAR